MSPTLATSFPSPEELKGTLQGTILYLVLYFGVMIPFQAFSKFYLMNQKTKGASSGMKGGASAKVDFRAVKYYNRTDHLALIGDRSVGQFVEYTIVFLPLLWLHALFLEGGAKQSWTISCLYSLTRAAYPVVFGYRVYPGVLWSAFPNYIILIYMLIRIIRASI